MDNLERFADPEETLRQALEDDRSKVWTLLPGVIVSFDPEEVTATVQPALQGVIRTQDGTAAAVNLPLLIHVPVVFPRGGGVTLTFPIKEGDECEVRFASRCIDGWWQSGGIQLPMDTRMHDLSDAFCTVGPQSQVKKISNISTTAAQLRTDDGEAFVELDPESHNVTVLTSGDVTINADGDLDAVVGGDAALEITGDLDVSVGGDLTAQVTGDLNVTAGGAAMLDIAGAFDSTATSISMAAPTITLTGVVNVVGALNVSGLASLNGGFGALPRFGGAPSTIHSDVMITGISTLADTNMNAATMTSSNVGGKDNGPAHKHISASPGNPTGGII